MLDNDTYLSPRLTIDVSLFSRKSIVREPRPAGVPCDTVNVCNWLPLTLNVFRRLLPLSNCTSSMVQFMNIHLRIMFRKANISIKVVICTLSSVKWAIA